jgi:hypothetical protein
VLSKTRFDTTADTFSAEDLNIRLGMSYVLNRQPTVTHTRADGSTFVEKVNPVYFSIAPYLGLGVAVGPPIGPQAATTATATPPAVPKDDSGVRVSPNVGLNLKLHF